MELQRGEDNKYEDMPYSNLSTKDPKRETASINGG